MAYPTPNAAFISAQPKQYDIQSNFGMYPGESLLYHNEMRTGCLNLGDHYWTSVTDIRLIIRRKECICCLCCCTSPTKDFCIYLQDIGQVKEIQGNCNCCECLFCCRMCCPKRLQVQGIFGQETIYLKKQDISDFEFMIGEAIGRHKLVIQ